MVMHKLKSDGSFKKYNDLKLEREVEVGEELDLTLARAKEVNQALENYGLVWERVEEPEK